MASTAGVKMVAGDQEIVEPETETTGQYVEPPFTSTAYQIDPCEAFGTVTDPVDPAGIDAVPERREIGSVTSSTKCPDASQT